jgi:hypothetical protein
MRESIIRQNIRTFGMAKKTGTAVRPKIPVINVLILFAHNSYVVVSVVFFHLLVPPSK